MSTNPLLQPVPLAEITAGLVKMRAERHVNRTVVEQELAAKRPILRIQWMRLTEPHSEESSLMFYRRHGVEIEDIARARRAPR
jgi:hypothetical protein